jgi:GNAT superfamily N-acetyltransferase
MIRIARFAEVGDNEAVRADLDRIFFENAATPEFFDEESRRAYHDFWLERYLRHAPESCFIAFDDGGEIAGYLAGSLVSDREPLPGPEYYRLFPRNFLEKFPAHVHVNVREGKRGQGMGRRLIEAFRAHCRENRMAGFHAVTRANRRPAHFFVRCGMAVQARVLWHNRQVVFVGEQLKP